MQTQAMSTPPNKPTTHCPQLQLPTHHIGQVSKLAETSIHRPVKCAQTDADDEHLQGARGSSETRTRNKKKKKMGGWERCIIHPHPNRKTPPEGRIKEPPNARSPSPNPTTLQHYMNMRLGKEAAKTPRKQGKLRTRGRVSEDHGNCTRRPP